MTQTPLPFHLTPRLLAVANLVRPGVCLADIGTDHAYLPAYLLHQNSIAFAFACDINEGPLNSAKTTLQGLGCPQKWQTVLAPGLAGVDPNLVDDIVIAGMGFDEMEGILTAGKAFATPHHHFVLQPMSGIHKVRQFLAKTGYVIQKEVAVTDRGHLYSVLDVTYDGACRTLTPAQSWCGAHLQQKDAQSVAYMQARIAAAKRVISGLLAAKQLDDAQQARLLWMQQVLEELAPFA